MSTKKPRNDGLAQIIHRKRGGRTIPRCEVILVGANPRATGFCAGVMVALSQIQNSLRVWPRERKITDTIRQEESPCHTWSVYTWFTPGLFPLRLWARDGDAGIVWGQIKIPILWSTAQSKENRQFSILSAFSTRLRVENFTVRRVGRLAVQARPPQGQILTGHCLIP